MGRKPAHPREDLLRFVPIQTRTKGLCIPLPGRIHGTSAFLNRTVRECSPGLLVDEESGVIKHCEGHRISKGNRKRRGNALSALVRAGSAGLFAGHDGNPHAFQLTEPI